MAVYVDEIKVYKREQIARSARKWGTHWCHMIADTDKELHAMAAAIGLNGNHFQGREYKAQYLRHYDLTPHKRQLAIRAGAKPINMRQLMELMASEDFTSVESNS